MEPASAPKIELNKMMRKGPFFIATRRPRRKGMVFVSWIWGSGTDVKTISAQIGSMIAVSQPSTPTADLLAAPSSVEEPLQYAPTMGAVIATRRPASRNISRLPVMRLRSL